MTTATADGIPAAKTPAPTLAAGVRLREIDMMRGLVIALMALDHVRDFMHAQAFTINPLDPNVTNPALYITRWITHLCAPTFVFLSGVSIWLQAAKGKPPAKLAWFLFTRGLWLIVLEATVISVGWSLWWPFPLFLQVIWAIGVAMMALSALVWLPRVAVLAIGLAIIVGHNLLDPITPQQLGGLGTFWLFVHEGGLLTLPSGQPIGLAAYPVLPWIGIMAAGYGAGPLFLKPAAVRDRLMFIIGPSMLALFALLRGFNLYGNPNASGGGPFPRVTLWTDEPTLGGQLMVFFDVQKYPPSLMFTLVTLGVMLTLFPLLARLRGALAHVLAVFGAVPFFFYLLHIYLAHVLAYIANSATGRDGTLILNYLVNTFTQKEGITTLGFPLSQVYLFWILVLAILYPLCAWWADLKKRRRDWWLSYL